MEKWLGKLLYAHHRHVVKLVHVVEYVPIVVATLHFYLHFDLINAAVCCSAVVQFERIDH